MDLYAGNGSRVIYHVIRGARKAESSHVEGKEPSGVK
jgi:hypothetical protein